MMTIRNRRMDETDDSPRLQRAIDAAPSDVLDIPKGIYELATPLRVTNLCSIRLHKSAILRAVKPMDYILTVDCQLQHDKEQRTADMPEAYNLFVEGAQRAGAGQRQSCVTHESVQMVIDGFEQGFGIGEVPDPVKALPEIRA